MPVAPAQDLECCTPGARQASAAGDTRIAGGSIERLGASSDGVFARRQGSSFRIRIAGYSPPRAPMPRAPLLAVPDTYCITQLNRAVAPQLGRRRHRGQRLD